MEAFLRLRRPVEVELSPDGRRMALTVSPIAKEKGKGLETGLWICDVGGDLARVGDSGGTYGLPRFSADSTRLAFASDLGHSGRMSLRLMGEGELGSIPGSIEDICWAPDGRSVLVLAADLGSHRAGTQTAMTIQEDGALENDPTVVRPAQHWRRLFLVDADRNIARAVTPEGINVFEFDWVGGKVVAVCTDDPTEGAWYEAWIGLIDIESRRVERVHTPEWQVQCPRISPQGRIAWIEGIASDRATVTGTIHVLGVGAVAPELDLTWFKFASEDKVWYSGWRRSGSMFGVLSLDGFIDERYGGEILIGVRLQPRVSPSADGRRIAAVLETTEEPPEVFLFEDGSRRPLTALNLELRSLLKTAEWRTYKWNSFDGLEIDGLLAVPARRDNTALPLVVYVHGGPTLRWPHALFAHALLLAQEGYAVLLPNPRGGVGRGQEFARANVGDLGGADFKDIVAGVDALVRDGTADDKYVAITGISYGGFMAAWAVTQTDRFAASIPYAAITDWLSFHLTSDIGRWDRRHMSADPFDPSGKYPERSPVYYAHKCKTPTLILHGDEDLSVPVSQATEFYNALVEAGCETELVIYPREGHGWLEREHQIDAWYRMQRWLARYFGPEI